MSRAVEHNPGPDTHDDPGWTGRAVLHVDMDAFFASVEQLDHPEWRGRPVIVGGPPDKRGVVAAASYEARACGVRSAMPSARAAMLCPDAIWTRGRFERYREISKAVMTELRKHSPEVDQVSIDEAYLDATPGAHGAHPVAVARGIRAAVAAMGITCSVGVAPNRTVAKVASDRDKPDGLTVVFPGDEGDFLAPLPVRALLGIGPKASSKLSDLGIRTLGDLAALDTATAVRLLGSGGPEAVRRASGEDPRPVRSSRASKSVSAERTFPSDIRHEPDVRSALHGLAGRVATRLRAAGRRGRTVTLKIRYADFTTRTVRRTFDRPTALQPDIEAVALGLLAEAWRPGVGVRLLGVGVSGFGDTHVQPGLFDPDDSAGAERHEALERGIDAVRRRFGPDAVTHGGADPTRDETEDYGPD